MNKTEKKNNMIYDKKHKKNYIDITDHIIESGLYEFYKANPKLMPDIYRHDF